MTLILSGSNGVSDVDGTAATPAIRGTDANTGIFFPAADTIAFAEGGVESMRLDSSGNLGLGVTPSAWASTSRALQIGAIAFIENNNNTSQYFGRNGFRGTGGGWIYSTSSVAQLYGMEPDGGFKWYTAPSGTAGNAISFTQAMTLDASGNLAIGKTSASGRLDVRSNGVPITWGGTGIYDNNYGTLTWGIDLAIVQANAGYALVFNTNGNNERARIDSSGRMQIGTTASRYSATLTILSATNSYNITSSRAGGGTGSLGHVVFENDNGAVGTIFTSGTTTSYNTSSDYRLKENIAPMTGALAKVAALKPCTYKWKVDGSDGEGFIAHELAEVVPQCVTGEKDAINEDGTPRYQGIDTSFLVATLTAAIQEQQAIITALTERVAALEAK